MKSADDDYDFAWLKDRIFYLIKFLSVRGFRIETFEETSNDHRTLSIRVYQERLKPSQRTSPKRHLRNENRHD